MPTLPQISLEQIDPEAVQAQLGQLARFSSAPAPAVTRVLWTEPDMQARAYLREQCATLGLEMREDGLGNLFARWRGTAPELPAVASGSHIDAIPNAGMYDGTVGVIGVLAAIRALQQVGFTPHRSIELVVFTAEEPTRFGIGCLGSRAMAGTLTPAQLASLRDSDGHTLGQARHAVGYTADLAHVTLPEGHYAAFIELHIEQGPVLEQAGIPIGIVQKIAAPSSLRITLTGEGGHAGAVLMPDRHDALLAAAELALAVEQAACSSGSPDTVGTTGVLRIAPGAVNSIPAHAVMEIDVRDTDLAARDRTLAAIRTATAAISGRRGVQATVELLNADPPALCAPALTDMVAHVCQTLGIAAQPMISRAYHDSLFMARVCPITMIFIPCYKGYSHRPDEYAAPEAIATGIAVLAQTLAHLSQVSA